MKKLLVLALISVMAFALFVPASANLTIPNPMMISEGYRGHWHSDGLDSLDSPISREALMNATGIVFEMPEAPAGYFFVFGGPGNGWWQTFENVGTYADGKLTIMFADIGLVPKNVMDDDTTPEDIDENGNPGGPRAYFQFFHNNWSTHYDTFGITNVVLLTPSGGGGGGGAAQTGVSFLLFPALGLVALGTTGAVIFGKKIKK